MTETEINSIEMNSFKIKVKHIMFEIILGFIQIKILTTL